jgi:hypothetical protein
LVVRATPRDYTWGAERVAVSLRMM